MFLGIFKIPDTESYRTTDSIPLTIICDNIREPNNLGAILRTCSGVGCENVILTKGTYISNILVFNVVVSSYFLNVYIFYLY